MDNKKYPGYNENDTNENDTNWDDYHRKNNVMTNEFKIICISDCKSISKSIYEVKKGQTFITNYIEFNYNGEEEFTYNGEEFSMRKKGFIRLSINNKIIGLFKKENFMRIEDWRNNIIEDIIENTI